MLEFSQYLENYLWPNYSKDAGHAHLMSIVYMVNEKFRERVEVWPIFENKCKEFPIFFQNIMKACLTEEEHKSDFREQTALLVFLNHCFNGMEIAICRDQVKKLVSLSMWSCLQPARREQEFKNNQEWKKFWKKIIKKDKTNISRDTEFERSFLHNLIVKFIGIIESIPEEGYLDMGKIHYCERFLELIIDLEALLPTRRFFNTVLDDSHMLIRAQLSNLVKRKEGKLFCQVRFEYYVMNTIREIANKCW